MKRSLKNRFIQVLVFALLFIILEVIFRQMGYKKGLMTDSIHPIKSIIPQALFQSDNYGVNSYSLNTSRIPNDYKLNSQGFISKLDFDSASLAKARIHNGEPLIFLVGDSYTEGCCDQPHDSSFARLLEKNLNAMTLNFGVGGSDLMQYRQLAVKYVPQLKPNLLILFFYLGNDICYYRRKVSPGIPNYYALKDYEWIDARIPPYLGQYPESTIHNSAIDAYNFQINNFTLWGKDVNFFEKGIRNSAVFSKIYLESNILFKKFWWGLTNSRKNDRVQLTNQLLFEIDSICKRNSTELFIIPIPSPTDVNKQVNLKESYEVLFEGMDYAFPQIEEFNLSDYDGPKARNHFLNSGHLKFYRFSKEQIQKRLVD